MPSRERGETGQGIIWIFRKVYAHAREAGFHEVQAHVGAGAHISEGQ